jgi:HAD superfamily hydrolase (TIGR01549 family)
VDQANRGFFSSEELAIQIAQRFNLSVGEYRARVEQGEVKDQVLLDYIVTLHKTYKTAMLSNVPRGSLKRRFGKGELGRYFDAVVISGETGYAKPDPEAYLVTAERLEVHIEECVFTDDRQHYLDGAQAVGMHSILYRNFVQFRVELEALLTYA